VLKDNAGQASALNAGSDQSRGEIVVFVDADDYPFPEAVERVVATWEAGLAKVHYRLQETDDAGKPGALHPPSDKPLDSGDVVPIMLSTGSYCFSATTCNAFARSALLEIFPIPEAEFRICADAYLLHLAPFHGKVGAIDEPLGVYRLHGGNAWSRPMPVTAAKGTLENRIELENIRKVFDMISRSKCSSSARPGTLDTSSPMI
jgi:glycosyltransferase involved in cell wall biosynthesis